MAHELEPIFRELGLSQYLDTFVDQGFDCWDTILDIQESDLDALGVKLGHRRKLQRRIANARGVAPSISLGPSSKQNGNEEPKQEAIRPDTTRPENGQHDNAGVAKRKYRRHPKPDENAPERPPSAYVLFSNKMREDLKSQNLTFTEIAKLVGENWQNLPPTEKEAFESQANAAKEKYHRDLVEYKKTLEYRRYVQYLQDFKQRQARQNQEEGSKRPRLEPARLRHGSSSSSATPAGSTTTGCGSGSEIPQQGEPSPNRKHRGNSTASLTESQHSSTAPTPLPHRNSLDESGLSPRTTRFDSNGSFEPLHSHTRKTSSWTDNGRSPDQSHTTLPSLSDVLDDTRMTSPVPPPLDKKPYSAGFVAANHRRPIPNSQPAFAHGRVPMLQHEASSSGSNGSITSNTSTLASSVSSAGYGRSSGDVSLPIHALLTNPSYDRKSISSTTDSAHPRKSDDSYTRGSGLGLRGYGFQSAPSAFQDMRVEQMADGDVVMTMDSAPHNNHSATSKGRYDGMNALLRAGEIVGREHQA
ncbi:hypothetical protein S40293_05343 [Stachybotrys chartarum IBT 40293]|nr:hypothetical protein S40293_05343 [Stachybotrys chartarum IBT 40293]